MMENFINVFMKVKLNPSNFYAPVCNFLFFLIYGIKRLSMKQDFSIFRKPKIYMRFLIDNMVLKPNYYEKIYILYDNKCARILPHLFLLSQRRFL